MIRRLGPRGAEWLNAVANHPAIRPTIGGLNSGPLDWGELLSLPSIYALYDLAGGGCLYTEWGPGLYEGHIQMLPGCRGRKAVEILEETVAYMFTQTDAIELIARVPDYNMGARVILNCLGAHRERTQENGWVRDGALCPVAWYSYTIHDWIRKSPVVHTEAIIVGGHPGKRDVFGRRLELMTSHVGDLNG